MIGSTKILSTAKKNPIVLDKLWENISLIENINQKYLDLSVLNQVFSENVLEWYGIL